MKNKPKQTFIDGLAGRKIERIQDFDLPMARFVAKYKNSSVLFSKKGRTESFFTEDSKLYLTPAEMRMLRRKERIVRITNRLDSLNSRLFANSKIYAANAPENFWSSRLRQAYAKFREQAAGVVQNSSQQITVARMWNLSIVGAVIFGMFTMTMIYRYLGQGVSAAIQDNSAQQAQIVQATQQQQQEVLAAETTQEINKNIDMDSVTSILSEQNNQQDLEKEITEMVKGTPLEKMAPLIAKKDRTVAAFMVGIAKQESGWGVHVPVYQGQDCFNYWGYRGKNPVGTGGHTCFASPEDAVDTVAKRIEFLVANDKLNTPNKMIIWKCGDCSWDNRNDMQIWINTVSTYFQKLNTN